ncbi:S8 family serine peptidase [Aurantiacibacter gilvus]|uniref:S8 family serine peptidase n=1 Tax=Aurantiacibacter gilvus TaxID=3139141 RepID=A0ABU9IAX0_9SPHN
MRPPFLPLFTLLFAGLALLASPLSAQVSVPQVGLPPVGPVVDPLLDQTDRLARDTLSEVDRLAEARLDRIDRLVRRNRRHIERDAAGEPARRGEIVLLEASSEQVAGAEAEGYRVIEQGELASLGMTFTRLALPRGTDLDEAQRELPELLPGVTVAPDNLYLTSGTAMAPAPQGGFARARPASGATVGMIDGAPGAAVPVAEIRGFASGGGEASDHGSAIASLLRGAGVSRVLAADVYGTDRAGGNAVAIAQALDWLVGADVRVVTISLVGPDNPILARAIAAARRRGAVVVAAVGNDGPAAPPAYPASYEGVVAVTAVDRRERALIEAGRALHLDYAAPGADIYGMDRRGRSQRLRGTSYATPLVAARLAHAIGNGRDWRGALDSEAHDLGEPGPDETYGRGLVCRGCGARD